MQPDGMLVVIAALTCAVICWQCVETRKAANASRIAAEAALRQADLVKEQSDLMVGKERAKLRIELEPFLPARSKDKEKVYEVKGSVFIYGASEAVIERSQIYASVGENGINEPLPEWLWGLHLPPVISAGSNPIPFRTLVIAKDGPAEDDEIRLVSEGKESVYCTAKIEFSNVFGQKWVLRVRRFRLLMPTTSLGAWEADGMAWEDEENRQQVSPPIFRPLEASHRAKKN